MKRKIILITMIVAVLACLFVISANAKTITYEGEEIELVDNLGDPSWYTGATASKIQDKESIVILKDAEGNMTAYPSYYIFRYYIEGSSVKINWADQKGVDYSFVNEKDTGKNYTSGSIYYVEVPYGITTFTPAGIWGKTESNVVEIVFSDSITSLENNTFENVKSLKKVTVSKNLTSLQMWTFNAATGLETVVFPEGSVLTSIGRGCFSGCTSLSSINLENCQSLKTLGDMVFSGCTAIDKLALPNSLETIGMQALYNLGEIELASDYLPTNLKTLSESFLASCKIKNEVLYFPEGFTSLSASYCFNSSTPTTSLTLVFLGKMTKVNLYYTSLLNIMNSGSKQPLKLVFAQNQFSDISGAVVELVDFNGKNGFITNYKDGSPKYTTQTGTLTVTLDNDSTWNGTSLGTDANGNTVYQADSASEMIFCGGDNVEISYTVRLNHTDKGWYRFHTTSEAYDVEGHKAADVHYEKITVDSAVNCGYDGITTNTCVICDISSQKVVPATGNHSYTIDDDCTTAHSCTVCLKEVVEALTHEISFTIDYENGYLSAGTKTFFCTNDGCKNSKEETTPSLFVSIGYSSPEYLEGSIIHTVIANKDAIDAYVENTGKTFEYGVVAAIHTDGKPVEVAEDGTITSKGQSIIAKMTNTDYTRIEVKLIGVTPGIAVNCNAYIVVDGKASYICEKEILDTAVSKTI